jgi:DNA-binding NtrC family response regulator
MKTQASAKVAPTDSTVFIIGETGSLPETLRRP